MSYQSVLDSWRDDSSFRRFHNSVVVDSDFAGLRWETPALTNDTVSQPYEFVLVSAPNFCKRRTDAVTFSKKFADANGANVLTFPSLGGDATLIVPTPEDDISFYGHLAAFVRGAPESQIDQIWKVIGEAVLAQISDKPIWLSTAGGGVAWLHVRIDSSPKYYHYAPFKKRPA
jgi:hypothetical protein